MGFGQSKKKESLESLRTDRGSRSDRGSKHSSNYSDDSERFVSPPTSLVNGFNNFFEFPSRSHAIVKPASDYHDAPDIATQSPCYTKTVPRASPGTLESKATFQDETTKHSSKVLKNQGVKDVEKTNQVSNQHDETQPNKSKLISGKINDSATAKFDKCGKDKRHPTASSIQERHNKQQHFNVERRQDGQKKLGRELQKGTQPSEQGHQQQRLPQQQQQKQLHTVTQQSLQQQTQHKHQAKVIQPNQQVHPQQEFQQNQKVLSTSDAGQQQLGKQKPSQQHHKQQMQEQNLQQTSHQLSKEQVHLQQQQKQKEKQHMNEQQKLQLKVHSNQPVKQKQPKQEKPQLMQQAPPQKLPHQQHEHSGPHAHLQNQHQNEMKLQKHSNGLQVDKQQQPQHNLKQKQTKPAQCQPQQNQHQDKQLPAALLQQQVLHQDNQLRMQSQAQQQPQQLGQQQQKEKLPGEKQQKEGIQQEKLPLQQPADQQRIEENPSKKTNKLSKKEQRALEWKQKQGEINQSDQQQPNEKQFHQQSQDLNHTDLPEQNGRKCKEEPHQQSTAIQAQESAKPLPPRQSNHLNDTQKQEKLSNKVAITVRLTYEADNKNSAKHGTQHVVEDTLKGKPIPLMAITFPKHGANCTLRTSNLQATMKSNTPVNATTSDASKEPVGKQTTLSVEARDMSDHSLNNATTTQSETSKKITKRPLTPFFPRKKKSQESVLNTSTDGSHEHDLNQNDHVEKMQHPTNQQQHHREKEQHQHQQKQQQNQQQQQHQKQQQQQQKQQEHQQQLPPQQQGQQDEPQSITPFVFQGTERPKLKPVHRLPDQHPPEFSTRAAVLQAQFSLNQQPKSPKTARKQKPVQGDAQMEKFKLIQKNDSTASTTKKSDCCAMNFQDSSVTVTHCVAPWAIVCDKMPDQVVSDTPLVGKKVKSKASKTSHREGHGFFSKIFGKKTTTEKIQPKHASSKTVSAEMERITQHMEDLRLSPSTSIHQDDATKCEAGTQIAEATPSKPEQEPEEDSESTADDSDSSTDLEPPSCLETWEIAEDVVEKALGLLPVPTAGKYVVPDSPFEPEFVKRLVADALEAKRGLKKVKEDQKLMEKFRDALLKFFEDKEISDVIPSCNHPPGTNQCNLQPVIQPLVDVLRQVLHEPKVANDQAKNGLIRQSELQQPHPRKYIKVRRRLKTGQAPTQLLIRFCQACGDTKQPDGRKLMSCGRCKDVVYCSKECQSVDWITHKFTCPGGDRRGYCKHHGT